MLKIILIWLANIAAKIILIIALTAWVIEVKGFEIQEMTASYKDDMFVWEAFPSSKNDFFYKKRTSLDKQTALYGLTQTPGFAIKTNLLYDLTSTLNLAVEFALGRKTTLDLSFNWNPWTFNKEENSKFKFLLLQPELRFWTCEAFRGHFFGIHGHYAYYNVGRLPNPPFPETMNQHRFEGQLAGAGVSYGYHWIIAPRWSLEAQIGAGYARLWYDKYPCQSCAKLISSDTKNYFGLTRAGINLMYIF